MDITSLLLGFNPADIAGATISGEVPVANALIDRVLAEAMTGRSGPVTGVRFEAQDADNMLIHLSLRGPIPQLKVAAHIDQQATPEKPVLVLRWSVPALGPLALFASPALAFLKTLPPGVRADGDRITIDIREAVQARGFGQYLNYLTGLTVHTRQGRLIVTFGARA